MATNSKSAKYVYLFGNKKADGNGSMKPLLGGKGANLAEMSRIGLPVPPGFTITTEVCTYYYDHGRKYPAQLRGDVEKHLQRVESILGARFGEPIARLRAVRRTQLHAGHDGDDPERRPQRRHARRFDREDGKFSFRLRRSTPPDPD